MGKRLTNLLSAVGLEVDFFSIIKDNVHKLVETDNVSFHFHVDVLVKPNTDSRPGLQVSKNQVL